MIKNNIKNNIIFIALFILLIFFLAYGYVAASEYIIEDQGSGDSGFSSGEGGGGGGGGGGGAPDITPPTISNIHTLINSDSFSITWNTNEPSISWIEYGLTQNYGSIIKTTTYSISHSINLTGLLSETDYHYRIKTKDKRANIGSYEDRTFTTLSTAESDLIAQLKARIAEILAEIVRLQTLLAQQLAGETGIPSDFRFNNNLKLGDVSEEVKYLQIFLNSDPETQLNAQLDQWGSRNKESIYFGPLTFNAVVRFQEKYFREVLTPWGITEGTGFVGFYTRAKINQLLGP